MKPANILRAFAAALAITLAASAPLAQVSTSITTHKVKKGETLYGVARQYNVPADSNIRYNPSAVNGLLEGQNLIIPGVGEAKAATEQQQNAGWRDANRPAQAQQPAVEQPAAQQPAPAAQEAPLNDGVDPTAQINPNAVAASDSAAVGDSLNRGIAPVERTITVSLIQPFMLQRVPTQKDQLTTDFYRGMLIAADSLRTLLPHVKLMVYDTRNDTKRLENYLAQEPQLREADIIIGPDNAEHLAIIANYCRENKVPLLNNFVLRDTTYLANPYVLHGNITSPDMTTTAIHELVTMCRNDSITPVLLHAEKPDKDMKSFVDAAQKALEEAGFTPRTIEYSSALTVEDLQGLPAGPGNNYIFIPNGSALEDFNRYAKAITAFKEQNLGTNIIRLFGYPEWVTFREKNQELMHSAETYIYSRFNPDSHSFNARDVLAAFQRWYRHSPVDGVPSQALWGFDTGCFVLYNLANGVSFRPGNTLPVSYNGVQNSYSFIRDDRNPEQGPANTAMYIVSYLPGGFIDARIVEK